MYIFNFFFYNYTLYYLSFILEAWQRIGKGFQHHVNGILCFNPEIIMLKNDVICSNSKNYN